MRDMTLLDAYQLFRNLDPGPVHLVIQRGDKTQVVILENPGQSFTLVSDSEDDMIQAYIDENGVIKLIETKIDQLTVPKVPIRKRLSTVSEEGSLV